MLVNIQFYILQNQISCSPSIYPDSPFNPNPIFNHQMFRTSFLGILVSHKRPWKAQNEVSLGTSKVTVPNRHMQVTGWWAINVSSKGRWRAGMAEETPGSWHEGQPQTRKNAQNLMGNFLDKQIYVIHFCMSILHNHRIEHEPGVILMTGWQWHQKCEGSPSGSATAPKCQVAPSLGSDGTATYPKGLSLWRKDWCWVGGKISQGYPRKPTTKLLRFVEVAVQTRASCSPRVWTSIFFSHSGWFFISSSSSKFKSSPKIYRIYIMPNYINDNF